MLNFHEFLHIMHKYVLNSVVKISLMFAQYFEYYAIIRRAALLWICCIVHTVTTHPERAECLTACKQKRFQ